MIATLNMILGKLTRQLVSKKLTPMDLQKFATIQDDRDCLAASAWVLPEARAAARHSSRLPPQLPWQDEGSMRPI